MVRLCFSSKLKVLNKGLNKTLICTSRSLSELGCFCAKDQVELLKVNVRLEMRPNLSLYQCSRLWNFFLPSYHFYLRFLRHSQELITTSCQLSPKLALGVMTWSFVPNCRVRGNRWDDKSQRSPQGAVVSFSCSLFQLYIVGQRRGISFLFFILSSRLCRHVLKPRQV